MKAISVIPSHFTWTDLSLRYIDTIILPNKKPEKASFFAIVFVLSLRMFYRDDSVRMK